MTSASGPPEYVPGSTRAAPPPGEYVPGSTQAAPPPGEYVPGSTQAAPPPGLQGGAAPLGTPGRRIGPYVVEKELGRGGMGVVLVVRHPQIPRPLAMKLILGDADPHALQRFGQEAQVMARVRHPNVVVVHELGRAPEGPYLVSELVEGTGLDRMLREGPLDPRQAATLVRALADGLAACHVAGVVHRDLKPANVLVRPDGSPVLLDFGIARDQTAERLTRTGQLMGTPAYMAPEQAEGLKGLDSRVDVYGLGAVLFECLCGRPPFSQDDPPMVILRKVLDEEPVWPRATHPAVPRALEDVVRVAMAKTAEARHRGMGDLRADLDRWLRGERPWASTRVPRDARGLRAAVALGGLLLAAAGVGGWLARRSAPPPVDAGPPVAEVASTASSDPGPVASAPARRTLAPWRSLPKGREQVVAAWRALREAQGAPDPDDARAVLNEHLDNEQAMYPIDKLACRAPVGHQRMPAWRGKYDCPARVLVGPREEVVLVRGDGCVGVWRDLRASLGKEGDGKNFPVIRSDHDEWVGGRPDALLRGSWAPAAWLEGALVVGDRTLVALALDGTRGRPLPGFEAAQDQVVRLLLSVPGAGLLTGEGGLREDEGKGALHLAARTFATLPGPPRSAAISDDGEWLVATGGAGGGRTSQSSLKVWRRKAAEWEPLPEVELFGTFDGLSFLPGETRFVVGTWSNTLELRDAREPQVVLGNFCDPKARLGHKSDENEALGTYAHDAGIHVTAVSGRNVWSGTMGVEVQVKPGQDEAYFRHAGDVRCWRIPPPDARGTFRTWMGWALSSPQGCYSLAFLGDDLLLVGDMCGYVSVYLVRP